MLLLLPHLSLASGPFADNRLREPNYAGPGREQGDPPGVKEVLIGYFGPAGDSGVRTSDCGLGDPNVAQVSNFGFRNSDFEFSADMWHAASMAVEQANQAGGYKGLPFRLVSAWSADPWGSGVKQLTRLVYANNVWAILGGVDGPTTHLAEQVAVKTRVPLLNPVSTDKTVNLTNVPWIFSCTPQDHLHAQVLAEELAAQLAGTKVRRSENEELGDESFPSSVPAFPPSVVLVSAVDHDSHLFCIELQKSVAATTLLFTYHYQFKPDRTDVNDLAQEICGGQAHAVVVIAGPRPSARLLRALWEDGYAGSIYGGPWMGQRAFIAEAGPHAEGVVFPCSYVHSAESAAFEADFVARFGRRPDYLAAHTYDAVNLLVAAVRRAGLNRARIRDALRELSPARGVSGPIIWDPPGSNRRPVRLCTIKNGQVVPLAQGRERHFVGAVGLP